MSPAIADPPVSEIGEPAASTWKRRAKTIPTMLGVTLVALLGAPIVIVGCGLADLARGKWRFPRVRLFLFGLQYLINDSVEIIAAPVLWALAGFGRRLDSQTSQLRHFRLQQWSLRALVARADGLLGIRLNVTGAAELAPSPAIYLCRHVSVLDASLPSALIERELDIVAKGVIMAEMLADPGFDLIYGRLGSVFINRDRGGDAKTAIVGLGRSLDHHSVGVIFPEGRLFEGGALQRSLDRLSVSDPQRYDELKNLRHVLPPRPGGFQAMLEGAPGSDVVVISHHGFETAPGFAELKASVPLRHEIEVRVERFSRTELPIEPDKQASWLDDRWLEMDRWVDQRALGASQRGTQ